MITLGPISIKSSDVLMCARAHELIAQRTDHPLHVGITEKREPFIPEISNPLWGLGHHPLPGDRRIPYASLLPGAPLEEIKIRPERGYCEDAGTP